MRIGIFSKFECSGGSEFRCVEMANAISAIPGYHGVLLVERKLPERVKAKIFPVTEVHEGIFSAPNLEPLYTIDRLIVVNSDSKEFTTLKYWHGETQRHSYRVDLRRVKSMSFLFNFIVSPSRHLDGLKTHVNDIRIITANTKFFYEISEQDRYIPVRHYPRLYLESPIAPDSICGTKASSTGVRLGMHSKSIANKWNADFHELVCAVNETHQSRISWSFMGMPDSVAATLTGISNVTVRKEFALTVKEFLFNLDIFVFFLSWGREEPWARSSAEALASGCPVISTPRGGNKDQIVHGNNGFFCKTTGEFVNACRLLIESTQTRQAMSRNARNGAHSFLSPAVIHKLLSFIEQ